MGDPSEVTQKEVFELWHLFRGGGCTRDQLQTRLQPLIITLGELLLQGMDSRDTGLVRHFQRLLARYPMLWLFSTVDGVEPTNNHAERVQRRAVLWRRKSFGCQSATGCRFVERILTVVQSLRLQGRNTLEFLGQPSPPTVKAYPHRRFAKSGEWLLLPLTVLYGTSAWLTAFFSSGQYLVRSRS